MKAKKLFVIIFTTLAFVITFSGDNSASASKWHKGLPSFLVNTKWKSEDMKLKYHDYGSERSDYIYDVNMIYTYSFNRNDSKFNVEDEFTGKTKNVKKESYTLKKYKYYKVSKNVYKLSYNMSGEDIINSHDFSYIYKINNDKFYLKLSEMMNTTFVSGNKMYLNKVK